MTTKSQPKVSAVLVFFPLPSNTGYAIDSYERAFFETAKRLVGDQDRIHFAFTDLRGGAPRTLPNDFTNLVEFDPTGRDERELNRISEYVQANRIDVAIGIDQPVHQPSFPALRASGVTTLISYWGAPISSLYGGLRLALRRLQIRFYPSRPDHYIFESEAMAKTATHGQGVATQDVSVVYLGVDAQKYSPDAAIPGYLTEHFGISPDRRVVFYSGHMEERKGVRVLVDAIRELVEIRGRDDVHLLILGNRPGEETRFLDRVSEGPAADYVTFGGYRNDVPAIVPNCYLGAIASTGWDSFTVSSLEIASAGLPLLVSDLQGLSETVEAGETGETFEPGNHQALADLIEEFLDHPDKRRRYAQAARARILGGFTQELQVQHLTDVCRAVLQGTVPSSLPSV